MFDLNIPWPAQTFADAQRAGAALRQHQHHQQQQHGGGSTAGPGSSALAPDGTEPPLSKKARKKLQKQQQQQQQAQGAASATSTAPAADVPEAAAGGTSSAPLPTAPEWNALDDLPAHDQVRLRLLAISLAALGYKTCAFNHTLPQAMRFDAARHANPFSALSPAAMVAGAQGGKGKGAAAQSLSAAAAQRRPITPVPFPELDPRFRGGSSSSSSSSKDKGKGKQRPSGLSSHLALDPSLLDPGSRATSETLRIVQLHRLTLPLDDASSSSAPGQGHGLTAAAAPALQSYDLLAVAPSTESAFSLACLHLAELRPFGIDIIALELGAQPRLPYWVKRSLVRTALQLGVVFEVAYAGALPAGGAAAASGGGAAPGGSGAAGGGGGGGAAETVRRNLISSTRSLLLLTKGTNVILSSGARDAMQLRAPLDVINLFGAVLGMGEAAARQAVSAGPEAVIRRARARKEVWRGIVGEVRVRQEPAAGRAAPSAALVPVEAATTSLGTAGAAKTGATATARTAAGSERVVGKRPDKQDADRRNKRKRDSVDAG